MIYLPAYLVLLQVNKLLSFVEHLFKKKEAVTFSEPHFLKNEGENFHFSLSLQQTFQLA